MKKSIKSIIAATMAVAMMIPCAAVSVSAATIEATSSQLQTAASNRWSDGGYLNPQILNLKEVSTYNKASVGKKINLEMSYDYSQFASLTKNGKKVTGVQLMAYNYDNKRWDPIDANGNFGTLSGGYFTLSSSVGAKRVANISISHLGSAYKRNGLMEFALCPVVYESGHMSLMNAQYYTAAVYYSYYNGMCLGTFR